MLRKKLKSNSLKLFLILPVPVCYVEVMFSIYSSFTSVHTVTNRWLFIIFLSTAKFIDFLVGIGIFCTQNVCDVKLPLVEESFLKMMCFIIIVFLMIRA